MDIQDRIRELIKKINELERREKPMLGAWTDYSATSTVTGWSAFTSKQVLYLRGSKLVFVRYFISGTSDAVGASFTLPQAATRGAIRDVGRAQDNGGAYVPGLISMDIGAALVNLGANANVPSNFTASGTKSVTGSFFYEIA